MQENEVEMASEAIATWRQEFLAEPPDFPIPILDFLPL